MSTIHLDVTSLDVTVVRDENQLAALAPHWHELAGDVPFRGFEWMETWWRHYRTHGCQLFIAVVTGEGDEVVGIAPWYLTRSSRQGRVVRFLGSGEVCSDYLTVLTRDESAMAVAERLADWLATDAVQEWNLLDLKGVEAGDETISQLGRRLEENGHVVDRQADQSCWRSELSNSWDAYLATLSKSRRARTRTLLRRTVEAGRAVIHEVRTESELERAFEILVDLHQRRRHTLSQSGCFASRRFTEFHREMTRRLLAGGQLRMLWTELDGRAASVEYGFVGGEAIYYYLGGLEPELTDEQPGWLGLASSLRLAIEQGYQVYDFLRGDESYKASWRATPRPLVHVRVVGKQASARVRYATWRACKGIKVWARQVLSLAKG